METITFDKLPEAVGSLSTKLDNILSLLQGGTYNHPATPVADELLTVAEAAELLHCQPATIYAKSRTNVIPHSKRGGKLYFSKAELLAWVKGGKVDTAAEVAQQAAAYIASKKAA